MLKTRLVVIVAFKLYNMCNCVFISNYYKVPCKIKCNNRLNISFTAFHFLDMTLTNIIIDRRVLSDEVLPEFLQKKAKCNAIIYYLFTFNAK